MLINRSLQRCLLLSVLSCLNKTACPQAKNITPDAIYSSSKGSVVTVLTFDNNKAPLEQGSGFVVAKDRIVTNYHVINGSSSASVVFDDGVVLPTDSLVAVSAAKDLAILKVN